MTIEEMKVKLKGMLSEKRYRHSLGVMETASRIASFYGENEEKASVAGLLHDFAREFDSERIKTQCKVLGVSVDAVSRIHPELIHAPLAAGLLKQEFDVDDVSIEDAIRYHTTGRAGMSMLEKIVFISDHIEPGRDFETVEAARQTAFKNINEAMLLALDNIIGYIIGKRKLIHPDSIEARNFIILTIKYGVEVKQIICGNIQT